MKIHVQYSDFEAIELDVQSTYTAEQIKEQIRSAYNISTEGKFLHFGCKRLTDSDVAGLRDGHLLQLIDDDTISMKSASPTGSGMDCKSNSPSPTPQSAIVQPILAKMAELTHLLYTVPVDASQIAIIGHSVDAAIMFLKSQRHKKNKKNHSLLRSIYKKH